MLETDPFTTDHGLQKGVKTVGHHIKDENNFLSFSDFTERYNIKTNFLTFHGMISAVKALWKKNQANLHNNNGSIYETIIDTFFKINVTVGSPVRARLSFAPFRSRDQCVFTSMVLTRVLVDYARLASPFCPLCGPKNFVATLYALKLDLSKQTNQMGELAAQFDL